jgi:hypothetical protein
LRRAAKATREWSGIFAIGPGGKHVSASACARLAGKISASTVFASARVRECLLFCGPKDVKNPDDNALNPELHADELASDLRLPNYVVHPRLRKIKRITLAAAREIGHDFIASTTASLVGTWVRGLKIAWLLIAGCLTALLISLIHSTSVATSPVTAEFYRGKAVRIPVGSPPGGGYNIYAHLIALALSAKLGATLFPPLLSVVTRARDNMICNDNAKHKHGWNKRTNPTIECVGHFRLKGLHDHAYQLRSEWYFILCFLHLANILIGLSFFQNLLRIKVFFLVGKSQF